MNGKSKRDIKDRRREIRKKLKEEDLARWAVQKEERKVQAQALSKKIYIEQMSIDDLITLEALTMKLNAMLLKGELKLVEGSFDQIYPAAYAEFTLTNTNERWVLNCRNDERNGGGSLKKVSSNSLS